MPHKILIIEDDEALRALLQEELASLPEFAVFAAKDRQSGRAIMAKIAPDLLIIEAGGELNEEFVRHLRADGLRAPIILLGQGEEDFAAWLGAAGANDYVTRPFRLTVLLARIKAQLRQYEQSEDAAFAIGPYILKPGQKLLLDKAQGKIRLTEKEAAILKYLYQAEGRAVERETLLEEVWGYNSGVTTHTLETHIYRLRQKIEQDPANAQILLTVQGGYKLAP
ncbi:MAG: DNA-binding response regulator [Candidatus Tokpelaia sp.]|nr:MAG: DNA-binding response regulator [Candidatus Tokpelaia sp.]KAA6206159.1 MAG: DNA-binding response regulator [Candidatus Tokpelaia sp.]